MCVVCIQEATVKAMEGKLTSSISLVSKCTGLALALQTFCSVSCGEDGL